MADNKTNSLLRLTTLAQLKRFDLCSVRGIMTLCDCES